MDSEQSHGQTLHVQEVILECTKLGYVLLSQPTTWRFVLEDGTARSLVVTPGLEKVSDVDGRSRQVLKPVSVAV